MMLGCKDITQLTSDYLDKELGLVKRMQFKLHLFMCKNCQRFVEQFGTTISLTSKLDVAKPGNDIIEDQIARIVKETRSNQ